MVGLNSFGIFGFLGGACIWLFLGLWFLIGWIVDGCCWCFFFFFFSSSLYCSIPKLKIQGFVGWFKFGFHLEFLGFSMEFAFGHFWVCGFSVAREVMVAIGVCLNQWLDQ